MIYRQYVHQTSRVGECVGVGVASRDCRTPDSKCNMAPP